MKEFGKAQKNFCSHLIVLTSCAQSTKSDKPEQTDKLTQAQTEIETTKADQETEKEEITKNADCPDFDFNSAQQQADSLIAFMEKATDSSPYQTQLIMINT